MNIVSSRARGVRRGLRRMGTRTDHRRPHKVATFQRVDPDNVHKLCPSFEEIMDELLALALAKGAA